MHGLVPQRRQIHNGKSSLCQTHLVTVSDGINLFSAVIRSSVDHRIIHDPKLFPCNILFGYKSAYSTHMILLLSVLLKYFLYIFFPLLQNSLSIDPFSDMECFSCQSFS